MNVLNRKMFANGGAAQQEPSIPDLIGYYVSQGYNALEIKEMLPDLDMNDIEAVVSQLGGSINPAVASPGANEFEGSFNVLPQIPETTVTANQDGMTTMNPSFPKGATPPELPNLDDISIVPPELQEFLAATAQFGKDQQLIMLTSPNYSFNLSEEEARQILNMPSVDIDMIAPEMPSDLPMVEEVGAETQIDTNISELGPNQYRNSEGQLFTIDPEKFEDVLMSENIRELEALIQNPDVEYGPALQEIFRQVVGKRKATFAGTSPSTFEFGTRLPSSLSYGSAAISAFDFLKDLTKQTGEGIANLGMGAARGLRADQGDYKPKDFFPSERFDFDENNIMGQSDDFSNKSGVLREGFSNEALDGIILRSSLGEIDQSLQDIAAEDVKDTATPETPTTDDDAIGTPIEGDAKTEDGETITGTSTDPKGTGSKPGEDSEEDKLDPIIKAADENDQAEQLSQSLGFFQQPDTQRLIRNIGKGLTQYGNFAEGIGKGSAAAAEERVLQEQLDAKREADLAAAGGLEFGDRKNILATTQEMNLSVRDYNNAVAAQELAESVIDFANGNSNIATFGAKIGAGLDDILAATGYKSVTEVDQLKDTKRAQIALTILTNRNIKEILGESGRTISNIDRDIAKKVVGSLDILKLDNIATLKATLEDNIRSIVEKRNEAQRNIQASVRFLAPYDPDAIDSEIIKIFKDELGQQMPAGYTSKSSSSSPDSDAIFIDTTQ